MSQRCQGWHQLGSDEFLEPKCTETDLQKSKTCSIWTYLNLTQFGPTLTSWLNVSREINRPSEKKELRYIVYDGDVDALWVENMNSVMDDNRLLTLSNGERIRLQNYCAMLFEVSRITDIYRHQLFIVTLSWKSGHLEFLLSMFLIFYLSKNQKMKLADRLMCLNRRRVWSTLILTV